MILRVMERVIKIPTAELMQSVREAYERGQTIEALRRAESFAPLRAWGGVESCALAARIAANSGAPRLSRRLAARTWRENRNHPVAQMQYGFEILEMRGPLAAWLAMRQWTTPADATAEQQADLAALKAQAAILLRDFSGGEALLDRAETLDPRDPWVRLQRSHLLERQDRVEEALVIADSARELHPHPFYRPGVQMSAHLLQLLDRDEDAIELLQQANVVLQNGPIVGQWYAILSENGRWSEAETALDRYVEMTPLRERPVERWVNSQRARVAYHLGKRADAARFAAALDDDFHRRFAEKIAAEPAEPERIQLDVSFVRQHFKTCAPATLAALGRFWRMPAEHLKLAEAMCYDGTPNWQQRQWAEDNGWFVREFRVTHQTAVALIEKNIPFAISVVDSTSAHMMAVIGFDRVRGTLLLRDPGQPYVLEPSADEFLERYRAFGPHGMVFLPISEKARLDGVALPDTDVQDEYHWFRLALAKHARADAAAIVARMETAVPDHRLTWEAKLGLGAYDANHSEQARCLDKLLELHPNNAARLLQRFNCLRDAPREERIKFLEQACAVKDADPALCVELARALEGDARYLPQAERWLKRGLRFRQMDSDAIVVRADLFWEQGKRQEATELYRFAANIESFREGLYQSWFIACRQTRRTDEALKHLQDRFARFGRRSEQPALTLAWALRELEQPARAREVLAEAARLRPDDSYLLVRSAALVAGLGEIAEAERLLTAARTRVRENDWLRAAAEIAELRRDAVEALRLAREILKREPLALDAHGGVARALGRLEGTRAALAHLKSACVEFPHHYGLRRMLMDWSRDAGANVAEAAARELLRIDPSDAWSRRELALALTKLNQVEAGLAEAEEAARIEPRNSYSFSVLGHIHLRLGRIAEARTHFRRAIELSVDNSDALQVLLDLARTDRERKEELSFIEQQLIQQIVTGDGLLIFLELARQVIDRETLLRSLQQAHAERPDLWHAWAALVSHLGHLGQLQEALDLARQATEKFPHLPRAWLDVAKVHQWRNEPEEEIAAAERAFEINPAWNRSTLALTDALERRGRLDDARKVYERALQHSPNDPQLHACHAHLLWRQRQKEAAFAAVERALRLAPGYDWAWTLMNEWATDSGELERTANFSRALTRERPGENRVWLNLARVLNNPTQTQERLAAVNKAIELERHSTEAWDLKAQFLAIAEQFDDAIRTCEEGRAVCTMDIYVLQGRRAWIEAQRRQFPAAIRLMREVLTETASYAWGWNQLARWLAEQGELAEAANALEQVRRLCPHDSWVNQQLGLLRLKQKDLAGAQQAFATALRLAPTDSYAAQNILDLQLKSGDLKGAATTLAVMQTHQPGAQTLASEIRLRIREEDRNAALKGFQTLCLLPDPDPWPIDVVTNAFERAGWSRTALKILRQSLKNPSCNPEAGAAAIRLLIKKRQDLAAAWLFLRLKPGELQRRAAGPLIHGLGQLKSKMVFRWVFWRRREVLARDDAAWGHVGYALSNFNRMKDVTRWLADWRSRPNVQPWMLFNGCLALRYAGRYDEANELARHVVKVWGHREGSADLRLFLAVEDALVGAVPAALLHLKLVVARDEVPHDRELVALARALVEFWQTPVADRAKQFNAARKKLEPHFPAWRMLHVMKDVRRTFRRAGEVFVREGGGWRARLWFAWKLHWQWLLILIIPPVAIYLQWLAR